MYALRGYLQCVCLLSDSIDDAPVFLEFIQIGVGLNVGDGIEAPDPSVVVHEHPVDELEGVKLAVLVAMLIDEIVENTDLINAQGRLLLDLCLPRRAGSNNFAIGANLRLLESRII